MSDFGWLKEITAAAAIVFFCYLLLRAILGRADVLTKAVLNRSKEDSATIKEMADDIAVTLRDIEMNMEKRDNLMMNHMEHFEQTLKHIEDTQLTISNILSRVCREFDINEDYRRGE